MGSQQLGCPRKGHWHGVWHSLSLLSSNACSFLCSGCGHSYCSTVWDFLISRSILTALSKTRYLTFSLPFRQPEDETLSSVGRKVPLGFLYKTMTHRYSCSQLRHVDESSSAASRVCSVLQQQFSNVPWSHLLNSKCTDESGEGWTCGGKHESSAIPLRFLLKYYFSSQTEITWQLHSSTCICITSRSLPAARPAWHLCLWNLLLIQKGVFMSNWVILCADQEVIFLSLTPLMQNIWQQVFITNVHRWTSVATGMNASNTCKNKESWSSADEPEHLKSWLTGSRWKFWDLSEILVETQAALETSQGNYIRSLLAHHLRSKQ